MARRLLQGYLSENMLSYTRYRKTVGWKKMDESLPTARVAGGDFGRRPMKPCSPISVYSYEYLCLFFR